MKILVGGVPFGCHNVGDEAILECAAGILRSAAPGAALTVSTNDQEATARKLGVQTRELFGFDLPYNRRAMLEALSEHDVFVWCGATGLSDYPEIPLSMLRIAQAAGKRTVLWGVGMNSELNPAKYKVLPGRRRQLLRFLGMASGGLWDGIAWEERRRAGRVRRLIAERVGAADLVVTRDPETNEELERCGVKREIVTGADSALVLQPSDFEKIALTEEARRWIAGPGKKVGVCISTAAPHFQDLEKLVACLDRMAGDEDARLVFLPMDPITDTRLMMDLREKMRFRERALVVEGRFEPSEILALAARLDAVVTSRLHLLILSSIVATPFAGISCGSKVDNFLRAFGLKPAGTVTRCDFEMLYRETRRLLDNREQFQTQIRAVRKTLLDRLTLATHRLAEVLKAPNSCAL